MVLTVVLAGALAASVAAVKYRPDLFDGQLWTSLLFLSVAFFGSFVYNVFIYPEFISPLRHLPVPPDGNLIFGHFRKLVSEPWTFPEEYWANTVPNSGLFRYRGLFGAQVLVATSPKVAMEICSTRVYDFEKPEWLFNGFGKSMGFTSILFARGGVHKRMRKMFNPAFHGRYIKALVPVFWNKSQTLIRELGKEVREEKKGDEDPVVDMSEWASRATLDIIGQAGFNYDFRTLYKERTAVSDAYKVAFDPPRTEAIRYIMYILLFFPKLTYVLDALPFPDAVEMKRSYLLMWDLAKTIISDKNEPANKDGKDLLSIVKSMGESSDDELRDQVLTFLAAGHETTSSATAWALHVLVQDMALQSQLRAEIHRVLPTSTSPINESTLAELRLLRNFTNELLRFHPPAPMLPREAVRDTTLNGVRVPKGTLVHLPFQAMNKSTELWGPTAREFDPSRWEQENGGAKSNYANMTFSAGPRICIGKEFAKEEFVILLSALLGKFEFGLVEGDHMHKIGDGLTNKPFGGIKCTVKELDW